MSRSSDLAGNGGRAVTLDRANRAMRSGKFEGGVQIGYERNDIRLRKGHLRGADVEKTVPEGVYTISVNVGDGTVGGDIHIARKQTYTDLLAWLDRRARGDGIGCRR